MGRLLTTLAQISPLDCAEECLIRPGCLSFNYRRSAIFCELNYENGSRSDANMTSEDGWIFSLRETWPLELTGTCQHSNCDLNEKCKSGSFGSFKCELAQCHPVNLSLPNNTTPFKSDIAVDFGSRHLLNCAEGYNQTGDELVRCLWNGLWSDVNITCLDATFKINPLKLCKYKILQGTKNGKQKAVEACRKINGSLLEIETEEELSLIVNNITIIQGYRKTPPVFPFYLGANIIEDQFVWETTNMSIDSSFLQVNLNKQENYKCLLMDNQSGSVNLKKYLCEEVKTVLCEMKSC
ncbi:uncharacterized protein LOC133184895 [Saccostrea echinata]|uniref:uncharacterized protein LOC133184895 n=1 Tax=Saccostrea echinata TaxID=191078 RepID=UPI002A807C03|nr:uncharacterized protein LOC133184895 [Saccostrea echinata]